jgi:hypothetical protein
MNKAASTRLLCRSIALAAISSAASLVGCGHGSNPPAATEAKSAAPAENSAVVASPSAAAAPAPSFAASAVQPAAKPDPKQVFKAHDRDLYERAGKMQNDEQFAEAGKLYEEIVQLNAQFCGNDHYRTRFARNRLRENQWFASLSAEGRKRLKESRQLGDTAMEDRAQGRPAAAVDHTRQSAKILADLGGKETIAFGKLCELNGVSSADLGDAAAADRMLRAAIDVYGKTVGHPSLEQSSALAAMSEMFAAQGDMQASLQSIMQGVNAESACRLGGEPDAMASYLLCKLGRRFRDLGEYALAENIFKQCANVARMAHGIRSNEYIGCTQDLAAAYLYQGKLRETESLELEVLELMGQGAAAGSSAMDILARGLLGTAYVQMGKFDMADPILLRTLDLARNSIGENSPYVGLLMGGVAELYISRKQYQAAEPLLTRALALAEPKNNLYKPWYARLLNDQMNLLRNTGRAAEAAKVQSRQDAMESSRVALCGKLRDAGLLPKAAAADSTPQIAERPAPTTR